MVTRHLPRCAQRLYLAILSGWENYSVVAGGGAVSGGGSGAPKRIDESVDGDGERVPETFTPDSTKFVDSPGAGGGAVDSEALVPPAAS